MEQSRVLTISATYGAGGSLVAPAAAARLQLPFFDRLLHGPDTRRAEAIMERLSDEERRHAPPGRLAATLAHLSAGLGIPVPDERDLNPREVLRRSVTASISNIVASGGGVILGRGGAVVLAGQPFAFHVRLDGPPERRLRQGMEIEGADEQAARAHQADADRAWSQFVQRVLDRDPADGRLYHLVLDSTVVPLDTCAEVVAAAAAAYWERAGCR
jgi:Cytidylate kinase-like family